MDRKFDKNKIKQFATLVLGVFILFSFTHADFKLEQKKQINKVSNIGTINEKEVSPKALFLDCWQIIKTNYYAHDLNEQNWLKWKKRYLHQIKTHEDAHVAINSMLASLDDSYSKFMSEKEFLEQNNAMNSKLYGIGINIASLSGKIYIVNVQEILFLT